jgi:hypothetical protein
MSTARAILLAAVLIAGAIVAHGYRDRQQGALVTRVDSLETRLRRLSDSTDFRIVRLAKAGNATLDLILHRR